MAIADTAPCGKSGALPLAGGARTPAWFSVGRPVAAAIAWLTVQWCCSRCGAAIRRSAVVSAIGLAFERYLTALFCSAKLGNLNE